MFIPLSILLQIGETDSAGEIFGDFLEQIPTTLIVMVCGTGLLLFVAFAWFAYFKPLRKAWVQSRQEISETTSEPTPQPAPEPTPAPPSPEPRRMDTGQLPDLDMLLDPSSMEKELPPVDPAEIAPPPQPSQPPAETPPRNPAPTDGRLRVRLANGAVIPAEDVLHVLRDPRDGRLMVEINGTAYRTFIGEPDAKETFVTTMRELSNVVVKADDNPPQPDETPAAPPPPRPRHSAPPPPVSTEGDMPGDLPSYRMEDNLRPSRTGRYESTPVPDLNIANAIEAYLQHKLKHTPEYAGLNLHVQSAPGGGVRIQVGDRYYEAVSDIEDDDIREFLSETIQEWQSRQ